jgi:hypothetical protein
MRQRPAHALFWPMTLIRLLLISSLIRIRSGMKANTNRIDEERARSMHLQNPKSDSPKEHEMCAGVANSTRHHQIKRREIRNAERIFYKWKSLLSDFFKNSFMQTRMYAYIVILFPCLLNIMALWWFIQINRFDASVMIWCQKRWFIPSFCFCSEMHKTHCVPGWVLLAREIL